MAGAHGGPAHRYLRHFNGLGVTEVVTGTSDGTLKQDTTFKVTAGLADAACYSFESRNFPGSYLRHFNSRIQRDARDGSAPFDQDATFCAQPGLSGSGVSFQSFNFPERYVRHATSELWIAGGAGSRSAWDSPASFTADATWNVASPWAP